MVTDSSCSSQLWWGINEIFCFTKIERSVFRVPIGRELWLMLFKVREKKEETETKKGALGVGVAGALTKITGYRLQVHVTVLLINNWDKQFTLKLKLYFGLWLRLRDTFSVVYLIVTWLPVLYPDLWPVICHSGFVPAVPGDIKNTLTRIKPWTFER